MKDSSETSRNRKPKVSHKTYADFPLFAHQTEHWAKKIHAKIRFYGPRPYRRWEIGSRGKSLNA